MPGIEGFYVGLVPPLTSPAQILALLAVGVFFGQRRDARPWLPVAVFACVCLAGVLAGLSGVRFDAAGPGLLLLALLVATLAALWPLTPALPGLAAAGVAGLDSAATICTASRASTKATATKSRFLRMSLSL